MIRRIVIEINEDSSTIVKYITDEKDIKVCECNNNNFTINEDLNKTTIVIIGNLLRQYGRVLLNQFRNLTIK